MATKHRHMHSEQSCSLCTYTYISIIKYKGAIQWSVTRPRYAKMSSTVNGKDFQTSIYTYNQGDALQLTNTWEESIFTTTAYTIHWLRSKNKWFFNTPVEISKKWLKAQTRLGDEVCCHTSTNNVRLATKLTSWFIPNWIKLTFTEVFLLTWKI